jgi:cytochrome P450
MNEMTVSVLTALPDHVPPGRILAENPWAGGGSDPHAWATRVAGEGGLRYTPHHPLGSGFGKGCWVALGAKEIRAILIDNKNFISRGATGVGQLIGEDLILAPLESDAPDHQRLRGILQPLFQPSEIIKYRERIRSVGLELIAAVAVRGGCEFIQDYALKLPTQIFLELFGLPLSDLPVFLEWEDIIMGRSHPEKAPGAWLSIRHYLETAIKERRANPTGDLLSHVVAQTGEQGVNPDKEAVGMAMILFVAGLDTVVTALGWQFRYLAEHPEEQERLRQNPSLIPAAVEEMLRAFSFTTILRIAARDVDIDGVQIKQGESVVCPTFLGSRDSVAYADPASVDFGRNATRHLAFGFGQHICVGMHLARLELITSIECWLANLPAFRMPESYLPACHGGVSLGLDELRLQW